MLDEIQEQLFPTTFELRHGCRNETAQNGAPQ